MLSRVAHRFVRSIRIQAPPSMARAFSPSTAPAVASQLLKPRRKRPQVMTPCTLRDFLQRPRRRRTARSVPRPQGNLDAALGSALRLALLFKIPTTCRRGLPIVAIPRQDLSPTSCRTQMVVSLPRREVFFLRHMSLRRVVWALRFRLRDRPRPPKRQDSRLPSTRGSHPKLARGALVMPLPPPPRCRCSGVHLG